MDKVYFVQEYVFKVMKFKWEWATLTRYGCYEKLGDCERTFNRLVGTAKSKRTTQKYRIIAKDVYGNEEIILGDFCNEE